MDSAQVEADTAALQKYVERLKGITDTTTAAQEKTKAFDEILGDSSQVAKDVARNTNNLDDVMKVYAASTRTATSVTAALGATLKSIGWNIAIAAVVAAIGVAVKLADEYLFHPYEHARDKAAEMSQAHEEAAQKVEELTKQIEELKAKMDECRSTTTGDIVDASPENIYNGEIGKLGGVRFVETTEAKIVSNKATSPINIFCTLFLGADAYGKTKVEGSGLEVIVKQKGSSGSADPLNQRSSVGWKAIKCAERLSEEYMVRVESGSTWSSQAAVN